MKPPLPPALRGRGAVVNPANRFEALHLEPDPDAPPDESGPVKTLFFKDKSQSLITRNDSPDIGFSAGFNAYRGCEHGCVYCFARPYHEYLGLSAGLDFETKIFVKENAPELLRKELSSPRWHPQGLAMSGVTDCYQPVERLLKITRRCLEVLADFRNPVGVVTKNFLVTRDADLYQTLAGFNAAAVFVTITTLDEDLARRMEPRASRPAHRLDAIRILAKAGVPVGVMAAPVIPGLTDPEIPKILRAAADAGARMAGYTVLRLPYGVKYLFEEWLERNFPDRKDKVLNRLKEMRGGKLNDPRFGSRMRGEGFYAEEIGRLFALSKKRFGLDRWKINLSTEHFRHPPGPQLMLF